MNSPNRTSASTRGLQEMFDSLANLSSGTAFPDIFKQMNSWKKILEKFIQITNFADGDGWKKQRFVRFLHAEQFNGSNLFQNLEQKKRQINSITSIRWVLTGHSILTIHGLGTAAKPDGSVQRVPVPFRPVSAGCATARRQAAGPERDDSSFRLCGSKVWPSPADQVDPCDSNGNNKALPAGIRT